MKNKQDKVYGLKLTYGDHSFKASEIGREFGYRTLPKQFEFDNTLKPIIPSSYSSTRSTKDTTPIVQVTDSVVDTALDAAESLLSEVGEVTTLQTHGADYAEIAWQRRLRNEAGKKKKRGWGNRENRIKNTCFSNSHSNIAPSNDKRPLFVQILATSSASLVSTSLPVQCLRSTNFFFFREIFPNSFLRHQNLITREVKKLARHQNLITEK
ncbi:hypothetical protein T231_13935 [Tannerella sp. oral taxon BU063 isolate Cell 6/7/9]|uniref:Uncharacterized protein n=1 Tax=Tannerella sp. oral taxon BU063 isolate Cell 6/7/9 TaxID=1411021 RepID=W2CNY6_9BACT|nr:hypothetical protein T231_13935 [Tannerella sp. oral taxon BU063 isolate Cell 6/7/9]